MSMYEIRLECLKEAFRQRGDGPHNMDKIIEAARKMAEFVTRDDRREPLPASNQHTD